MNNKELKNEFNKLDLLIKKTNNKELIDLYLSLLKPLSTKVHKVHKKQYEDYLTTTKWRSKREELFNIRGKNCENCGSDKLIQVHHLTYENIFNEKLEDLKILCRNCHIKEHKKY
jgi:5-methylcytosine-specific restriction endonuclease McrA